MHQAKNVMTKVNKKSNLKINQMHMHQIKDQVKEDMMITRVWQQVSINSLTTKMKFTTLLMISNKIIKKLKISGEMIFKLFRAMYYKSKEQKRDRLQATWNS
jgi:hypothetical protein